MQSEIHFLKNTMAIKKALNLDTQEYLTAFGMTPKEAEKFLFRPKDLPVSYAMNFCQRFDLDLENIFSESFDIQAFIKKNLKNEILLPEQYQKEKNSRVITLINFTKGLEISGLGWLTDLIFQRLQIPKTLLHFPQMHIPNKLIVDFLALVENFRTDLNVLQYCGQLGMENLNHTFGFVRPGMKVSTEFYEKFFLEDIKLFDKTYEYQISKISDDTLFLRFELKEEFKDLYQCQILSNDAFLNYKTGIASGISILYGLNKSETKILRNGRYDGYDLLSIKIPKQHSEPLRLLH